MKLFNNPDVTLQQEDPPRSTGCFPEPSGTFTRHISVNYVGYWEEEGRNFFSLAQCGPL